jgi:DNA ligase 1
MKHRNDTDYFKPLASILLTCAIGNATALAKAGVDAPQLMLANVYDADAMNVAEYLVSEKYDGVRAFWDGRMLRSRSGHVIQAPDWFVAALPTMALDGELWIGRGQFETLSATVRRQTPDDTAWRTVSYMVFDAPRTPGRFDQRYAALRKQLSNAQPAWLHLVAQDRVADDAHLQFRLAEVLAVGGEGLMLHRASSLYRGDRSDDLVKLKAVTDAEARVVASMPGSGKYVGMMGALEVETREGIRFRIGTGFNDAQRKTPPPTGSWITYAYQGVTDGGIPRFARFVRVRSPEK